jgi:hypothetical protein
MIDLFSILFLLIIIILVYIVYNKNKNKNKIYVYNDPMLNKIYKDLEKLVPNLSKLDIRLYGANDTLTENKKKIYLCLKHPNGTYYDYNTILYIAIHELAHVLNDEYDTTGNHGAKFNQINEVLLKRAESLNLIDLNKPIKYDMCGTI